MPLVVRSSAKSLSSAKTSTSLIKKDIRFDSNREIVKRSSISWVSRSVSRRKVAWYRSRFRSSRSLESKSRYKLRFANGVRSSWETSETNWVFMLSNSWKRVTSRKTTTKPDCWSGRGNDEERAWYILPFTSTMAFSSGSLPDFKRTHKIMAEELSLSRFCLFKQVLASLVRFKQVFIALKNENSVWNRFQDCFDTVLGDA